MRKIPATMATQHPDNASPHPLSGKAFVATSEEVEEAHYCFSELDCREFMWDWEGKHVDEAVVEKLLEKHHDFYRKNPLGKERFLTFRVPNVWREKGYRVARAFANLISANDLMEEMKLHAPPVFEVILPMTTSAKELFFLRSKYAEIVKAFEVLKTPGPQDIELIPLVEEPEEMLGVGTLLREYVAVCQGSPFKKFDVEYLRPFLARSDPALNAGMVPAVLAVKGALSQCAEFSEETGIPTHPILGAGSLPFRGHLSPENLENFIEEYPGLRTVTVQSAFRADYPLPTVKKAIGRLNSGLNQKARRLEAQEAKDVEALVALFTKEYRAAIEDLAPAIKNVAAFVPPRRERKQHIGLFGYARSIGKHSLPRAITFTGALYSMGVPPELIGTGRGLLQAKKEGKLETLLDLYVHLQDDVEAAGRYLNQENLKTLASQEKAWKLVQEDVLAIENVLGIELGPQTQAQEEHNKLTGKIRQILGKAKNPQKEIVEAAVLRQSMG